MKTVSVSELRSRLKEIITCVKRGEEVRVTQNGEVVAAMLHPSRLKPRIRTVNTIAAEKLMKEFEELKRNPPDLNDIGEGLSLEYAEELVQSIRAERDSE